MKKLRRESLYGVDKKAEKIFSARDVEIVLSEIDELQGKEIKIRKDADDTIHVFVNNNEYVFD